MKHTHKAKKIQDFIIQLYNDEKIPKYIKSKALNIEIAIASKKDDTLIEQMYASLKAEVEKLNSIDKS